jgi:hypothetical protein
MTSFALDFHAFGFAVRDFAIGALPLAYLNQLTSFLHFVELLFSFRLSERNFRFHHFALLFKD